MTEPTKDPNAIDHMTAEELYARQYELKCQVPAAKNVLAAIDQELTLLDWKLRYPGLTRKQLSTVLSVVRDHVSDLDSVVASLTKTRDCKVCYGTGWIGSNVHRKCPECRPESNGTP